MSTKSELHPRTELQRRMIEDLQLAGLSERTQEMYVRAVRQLAQHYGKPPDQITEEEERAYFLHIKNVKKWSRAGCTIALCGIKFFYEHTIHRQWSILDFVRPAAEKKLPEILCREEVRLILGHVRLFRYRACLSTIYSCGLRLKEGTPKSKPLASMPSAVSHCTTGGQLHYELCAKTNFASGQRCAHLVKKVVAGNNLRIAHRQNHREGAVLDA